MDRERFSILFRKYLANQLTSEELEELQAHIATDSEPSLMRNLIRQEMGHITEEGEEPIPVESMVSGLEAKVWQRIGRPLKKRKPGYYLVAASIAVLLCFAFGLRLGWYKQATIQQLSTTTAPGEIKTLTLADGSKVWLNAASTLHYPDAFKNGNREVQLTGEAFFDVVANGENPFIVTVQDTIQVTVLGTSFNIKSFTGDHAAKLSLLTGKVTVKTTTMNQTDLLTLKPGEEALWHRSRQGFTKKEIDPSHIASWRNNRLLFNEDPFQDVITTLERKYNVSISVLRDDLLQEHTSLTVGDEPLEQVLIPLSFSHHFTYQFANDSTVIIK